MALSRGGGGATHEFQLVGRSAPETPGSSSFCIADEEEEEDGMEDLERDADVEVGYTWEQARRKLELTGPNTLTPPVSCPQWLCCLLPCLLSTESMRRFHACVPESALVLRETEWTDVEARSLVVGDVVQLKHGDSAPADLKVASASADFSLSDASLTGKRSRLHPTVGDFVPLAATCVRGEGILIVTAVGDATLLASKLKDGSWPPKHP